MITVIANIKQGAKVEREKEFQVRSFVEFVARQRVGDLFYSQRTEFSLTHAEEFLTNQKVRDPDGFAFTSADGTREIQVEIVA